MVVSKKITDYLIKNKIAVWCTKVEEAKALARNIGGNYSDWNPAGCSNGFEVFLNGYSANWQPGYNKTYFIESKDAIKCIDYKDIFNLTPKLYELW